MLQLPKMVMPGDRRAGIMRGGVLQIHVTRACDKACYGCTQGSNLGGKPVLITVEQFEEACVSLKGYFGVVGMFGGNPCIHPQFEELCRVMRKHVPWEQRGLWSNALLGKGKHARITFNPAHSNFNVHEDKEAYKEFRRDWPEAFRYVKGLEDSRHSPVFVSMRDMGMNEEEIWKRVATCDINRLWSAMICVVRGNLRGFFCEIAGAQAMLHEAEADYPDTGIPIVHGWWQLRQEAFAEQIRLHCPDCGIPLRGYGALANSGPAEQVSERHKSIYKPKDRGRLVELVVLREQLREGALPKATDYIQNGSMK
jgi:MoaA/NifB/PqqE/SkfB family radical SAM enzyme